MSDHRPEAGSGLSVKAELTLAWPSWLGLSAWELACHALPTTVFVAQRLFVLSVSARHRTSQTVLSGTQAITTGRW
jgi:hypothetical protein